MELVTVLVVRGFKRRTGRLSGFTHKSAVGILLELVGYYEFSIIYKPLFYRSARLVLKTHILLLPIWPWNFYQDQNVQLAQLLVDHYKIFVFHQKAIYKPAYDELVV